MIWSLDNTAPYVLRWVAQGHYIDVFLNVIVWALPIYYGISYGPSLIHNIVCSEYVIVLIVLLQWLIALRVHAACGYMIKLLCLLCLMYRV